MNIDPTNYPNLTIDGPIFAKVELDDMINANVELWDLLEPERADKHLILPQFIEALAQDASLRISSNQLEGFTQKINAYHIKSITWKIVSMHEGVYLVDVPGFADTRISMTNIVSMLKEWIQESGAANLGRILYFTPIHCVRLPGSHRELLRTFQALTGAKSAGNITVVTSMWDSLWGDGAKKRAESNFNQLRDDVWKEFIDEGGQIVKFHNTQTSALSVLNTACRGLVGVQFGLEIHFEGEKQLKSAPFAIHLTDDLQNRIQNLEMEMAHTQMDLKGASERGDDLLTSTLVPKLKETELLLAKFKKELHENFGIIPTPSPDVPSAIDGSSNIDAPVMNSQPAETVDFCTAPSSSAPSLSGALGVPLQSSLSVPSPDSSADHPKARAFPIEAAAIKPLVVAVSSARPTSQSQVQTTSQIDPTPGVNQVEHHLLEPISPKRTVIARIIRSVKCCGDAVAERHDA